MTVLVTGATGTVGSEVVADLVAHGIEVSALTRDPSRSELPDGAQAVAGTLTDRDAMRAALEGVEGLFLLSPVAADELTGTLMTLDLAREAGVRAISYLSVIHADRFSEPPHFAAKRAAELMIADLDLPATILRPGYYTQNDLLERDRLAAGRYAPPLGSRGVLAVDVRDLGAVGAATLRERLAAPSSLPIRTLDVVAPEVLTGDDIAGRWAEALGHEVTYAGEDLDAFEEMFAGAPGWMVHDMRLMMRRFQTDGMTTPATTDDELVTLLGRPLRTYDDFVAEVAPGWRDS